MKRLTLFILVFSFLESKAQEKFTLDNYDSYFMLSNYETTSNKVAFTIEESCAIFINPTSNQILMLKKEYGESDFYTIADDTNWYNYKASEKLEKLNIKILNLESGILKFAGQSETWTLDLSQPGAPEWNFLLFNIKKAPLISSTVDVTDSELKKYFDID
ncbi:hypothetical protein [Reichenbachiella sp.]|uniref:hypothetical protein n=1 Tax=Reichenbachiella sp. TaxID=2184521 RepID=UPI003BB031DE